MFTQKYYEFWNLTRYVNILLQCWCAINVWNVKLFIWLKTNYFIITENPPERRYFTKLRYIYIYNMNSIYYMCSFVLRQISTKQIFGVWIY